MRLRYCDGCGDVLDDHDFAEGRAWVLENRPMCRRCADPPPGRALHAAIRRKERRHRALLKRGLR